ncbi:sirohydrochlorin chelatase [Mycobacterium szulgai]|uniref:Cobalamin biosynthesis protein CbiX n=1 Tax=Mycobacterium szulgai TaxID=1787 RepID=A0A1X2E113_MYCSZ|nr:sirohydrochlorin chelatase [Mycobacterium szulgai]MCV7077708.1 sirohydrochlorin chelatase [Mycobacterium szulgai]ORW94024.1 cobalamin biosynthesis protein CbiX [Mycobacterium szulgai]
MSLILTAHGTRRSSGIAMIGNLAEQVSRLVGQSVQVAFVDVLGPTPGELLSGLNSAQPAIVVPAFLSRGYHVRADLPGHVVASRHPSVTVTAALGPGPEIARIVAQQLVKSGWRSGDSVILGAAGTSDRRAQADLCHTATLLSALIGSRVDLGFAATGEPDIYQAVAAARRRGARRVVVASYLLADGLFQERLAGCGADLVTEPLGADPGLARLVANRFRRAVPRRTGGRSVLHLSNCMEHKALLTRHAGTSGA